MKKVVVVVVALVGLAIGIAAGVFVWLGNGAKGALAAPGQPTVVITVPKGATGQSLGALLVEEKLITDARFWKFHLRDKGKFSPKAGRHALSPSMTIPEIALQLEKAPIAEDEPFAMIEGWRLRDIDEALVQKGWTKPGEYQKAAQKPQKYKAPFALPATTLEGYLYPETYRVVTKPALDVDVLIQRQIDTFVARFYAPHKDEIEKSGRSLDEIVRMASMLEREEPVPAQRNLVAGILWKRIDMGFPLGVDATSRYELAEWNDRKAFLAKLRDPDDAYNTRHKKGLPPTPIGAPTVASLLAALRPEKTEYLYYLHDADKVLRPSRNGEEHEALRKKYNVY